MWWNGPPLLLDSPEVWPIMPTSLESDETNLELTKTVPLALHVLVTTSDCSSKSGVSILIDITCFRLLKVTAYVLKFVELCRRSCNVDDNRLTATDVLRAERIWTKAVQEHSFDAELQSLCGSGIITLLQKLVVDQQGIIHCKGCIDHLTVTENSKTPILMPTPHHFTDLLIHDRHNQVFHDGIWETLNLLRETHWIRCGREAVKRVLRKSEDMKEGLYQLRQLHNFPRIGSEITYYLL